MTIHEHHDTYFKQFATQAVDEGLKRRWSPPLLREARPHITVSMKYDDTRFAHLAECIVGGLGEHQYVTASFIDGGVDRDGQPNRHPEWMQYHAENMVRMAETGVFFKWFERTLPAEHREQFKKMYQNVRVQLVPSDPMHNQIDDSWLAVLTTDSGQWRETIGNIRRDPLLMYAVLTMVQK